MEANFFRFLGAELASLLIGRRIDKVFAPAPGVWTLKIQNSGDPLHLLFRPAKTEAHLFLSAVKPINPPNATAMAMWFRKRLRNRKIIGWKLDWPNLRLALELSPRLEPTSGKFLVLNARSGMKFTNELMEGFGQSPEWPALEDILENKDIWREYPHISPPFRKALSNLPEEQRHHFYMEMASGKMPLFFLHKSKQGWTSPLSWSRKEESESFVSALEAGNSYGERTLFPLLEMEEEKPGQTLLKRARKKVERNLARLEEEENRLQKLADEKIKAEALQAELYKFKLLEGLEVITATHPHHGPQTIPLNPYLSPTENMEHYFKLAAKADRGFPHIQRRRTELLAELKQLEAGGIPESQQQGKSPLPEATSSLPKRYKGLAVSLFRSSDGFTILRGKNKQANHAMLSRASSPFDYWLHLSDGPSSHVILKRDHPGQEVPQRTLVEAAILCGLKSYRQDDGKADIMYALVKDIRKIKGFAHGQVMVDQRKGTLRVDLDPTLEKRLGG